MTTVVCVLRSGGRYSPEWVYALKRGLNRHLDAFRFVCLTDIDGIPSVWRVPLEHDWPGWWAKIEVFRPGLLTGPVLYLDLDTLVVGDLSEVASYNGDLAMLSDFYRPRRAQSGVMAFVPGELTEALWARWTSDPEGWISGRRFRGDGEWLHHATGGERVDRLQALYPGQIVSLKAHARDRCPPDARLVCAHGKPKWDSPDAGWAHKEWLRMDPMEHAT